MESRGGGGHHFVSHSTRFTNRICSDLAHVSKLMDFRYWLHRPFLKDSEIISGQKKGWSFLAISDSSAEREGVSSQAGIFQLRAW